MTEEQKPETYKFDVEVESIMSIIINSVYSSKDYFLRELISNASDASDKFKLMWAEFKEKGLPVADLSELAIDIIPDEANKTLTIQDRGIGMTKSNLVNFLGIVANSGTKKFKEALAQSGKNTDVDALIGQFGLGFYSAFLVASQVDVITKHPEDIAYLWSSKGMGDFTITPYEGEIDSNGTRLILHIKEGDEEFMTVSKLKNLIKKYSMFVNYPIYLHEEKEVEEKPEEEKKDEEAKVEEVEGETEEPKVEEVVEEDASKVVKKRVVERQHINKDKPLWNRRPNDTTPEELKEFYKTISGDWDDYLAVKHCVLEGTINFTMLLFVPKKARFNMFEKNAKKNGIKLYCQNVFVTDDLGDAIPDWMMFVSGVISSNDLPMNVSREFLQGKNTMKTIKKMLNKKVLELIGEIANDPEKYKTFYSEFGTNIKLAVRENDGQQEKVAKLLRYYTTKSGDQMIDLDTYVNRMPEEQKQIYILTGLSKEETFKSPFLEPFQDYEVILMYEAVDEIMLQGFRKYDGKDIQRITSEGVEIPGEKKDDESIKAMEVVAEKLKEILKDSVEKVVLSPRLKNVPCLVSTGKYAHSAAMENIIRSQPGAEHNPFLSMMGMSKKIFEINPHHPIIMNMKIMIDEGKEEDLKSIAELLYTTALIECGYRIEDTSKYANSVFRYLSRSVDKSG
ncbi:heat shock protein 90 [Astathelohania contejeani]|uniref:Heat shock protein 90 n=1 Tax=Astathelohania contejeani TaxID=164912 RepID=A0ABQ7I059_9MICR|nr:heat shock protein 90 [Thelohania contejeani]